ncbi:MAG: hypothetical protein WCC92_10140 [Candidatus Korobacteraceae bacterium]
MSGRSPAGDLLRRPPDSEGKPNLSKRIEVVTPVPAEGPRTKLWEILDIYVRDGRQASILESDGTYLQS